MVELIARDRDLHLPPKRLRQTFYYQAPILTVLNRYLQADVYIFSRIFV